MISADFHDFIHDLMSALHKLRDIEKLQPTFTDEEDKKITAAQNRLRELLILDRRDRAYRRRRGEDAPEPPHISKNQLEHQRKWLGIEKPPEPEQQELANLKDRARELYPSLRRKSDDNDERQ